MSAPEPIRAFAVFHRPDDGEGCAGPPEMVRVPTADLMPCPLGIFPSERDAQNAMERDWPNGSEVRRVRIVEDTE